MKGFLAAALALGFATSAAAQTLEEARETYLAAWNAAPLAVRKAIFVTAPAVGYGLFEARADNVFAPDEPIYIYLEPVGYGWVAEGDVNRFGLSIGLRILTPEAQELFAQDDFLELTTSSAERPTEFFGNVTLNLTGLVPGSYVLELDLDDIASEESATVSIPLDVE